MTGSLPDVIRHLGWIDYLLIFACLLLIVFATTIVARLSSDEQGERTLRFRVNAIRGFAALCIALVGYYHFYATAQLSDGVAVRGLSILVIVYLAYLSANFIGELLHRRFGRRYKTGDVERIADTYTSRALSIFVSMFILIIALISIIRISGFTSLLEAGGVIGFIGVFLALTQGAWAPDLISGLIILNSKMFQERDVIKLTDSSGSLLGRVHRTRAFHTEVLNLVDNHRVMIRNSLIRDYSVHNLSLFANARGLRETMKFKIGYDVSPDRVRAMFEKAFERAVENPDILLEAQHPLEIRVNETGDHAIEWSIHYYTKDEAQLVKTRQLFLAEILDASLEDAISLATPLTHQAV